MHINNIEILFKIKKFDVGNNFIIISKTFQYATR